jgi:peroxiredoxin
LKKGTIFDMKKTLTVITVFLLALSCVGISWAVPKEPLKVGDEFPGFSLKDLNGKFFFLKEHIANAPNKKFKAILFSFCKYDCKACRKEYPELDKLRVKYTGKGLGIFLIDIMEDEERAGKLSSEIKTGLDMLVDRYGVVAKLAGVSSTPFTVLIDDMGKIRYMHTGFPDDEGKAGEIIAELEKQIAVVLGAGGAGTSR